ncbi:MAG: 50S ribosomal protein L21 [Nitrococcus sp.]|nr:50S ribosomal protein L21 [Nitrococcus sp.]
MYAVIRTGGKQYRVSEGDTLRVEKLDAELGAAIDFEQVLMIADTDDIQVGTPLIGGSIVSAEVTGQGRGRKIEVRKFKRRKNYHRCHGHRQHYTEVKITRIGAGTGVTDSLGNPHHGA